MNNKTIEQIVIESMEPTFAEQMTSEVEKYWRGYEWELLSMKVVLNHKPNMIISEINASLKCYYSSEGEYNAACDVASTLESLCPEKYTGKFTY